MNLLNFNPILFQPEMVKANLDGFKTETRRTTGLDAVNKNPDAYAFMGLDKDPSYVIGVDKWDNDVVKDFKGLYAEFELTNADFEEYRNIKCPYGQPGDILWVRETYATANGEYVYKADYSEERINHPRNKGIWKPSIHMPKEACRIFLLLKEVKIERLLDITEASAQAEGVEKSRLLGYGKLGEQSYREGFFNLFICINKVKDFSNYNPWLWVLKYEVISLSGISSAIKYLSKKHHFDYWMVKESFEKFLKRA